MLVVCTGKVADDPDKSTFPVKVFLPVNVLSVVNFAELELRLSMLVCSVVSAPCARLVSAAIEAPSIASAVTRVAASAATAVSAWLLAADKVAASPTMRAVASPATDVSVY